MEKKVTKEMLDSIVRNKTVRTKVVKESHEWFMPIYLNDHMEHETADFQREMIAITERDDLKLAVIVAFRGSAKSTIMTMSYPIWSILGRQEKKFVLIVSKTQQQAKLHLTNLKRVLENARLLKTDLGPFKEEVDEWGSYTLVIPKYNARITAASSEQSIRGMRHAQHRPDLIICDDVEDLQSVKTRDGRNKAYQWFTSEVIPVGDRNTKIILIGNLLHEDSLLMRVKEDIEEGRLAGLIRTFPIVSENGLITWPGKFKSMDDIEEEKTRIGDRIAWEREFMLNIVPDIDQVIFPDWIQHYDVLPKKEYRGTYIGIDLAISKRDTADYTAMVLAKVYKEAGDTMIYILPQVINKRLTFPETVEMCKRLNESYKDGHHRKFIIEDVAYQRALPQQLEQEGLNVMGVKVGSMDKRTRLALTAHRIETGKILFPKKGAEQLISQLVHFGVEKYDDLADAFSLMVLQVIEKPPVTPDIRWIITSPDPWRPVRTMDDLFH